MEEHQVTIPPQLIEKLRQARRVTVLTGAGTSAESGVPTFREAQTGLWAQYNPEELATPQAYARNPKLVWEWYSWRRKLVSEARPNPGHDALVTMEQHISQFTLITQNVDGMHQRAGSRRVIELHGNIARTKRADDHTIVETWDETDEVPPHCPHTGQMLRPDVVWFGESLPADALNAANEASANCDLFFSVGTSGVVQPAASLPFIAHRAGGVLVVVNLDATPHVPLATYHLRGGSGAVLPALVRATWP
jgi:NAD-dependent deacetylase